MSLWAMVAAECGAPCPSPIATCFSPFIVAQLVGAAQPRDALSPVYLLHTKHYMARTHTRALTESVGRAPGGTCAAAGRPCPVDIAAAGDACCVLARLCLLPPSRECVWRRGRARCTWTLSPARPPQSGQSATKMRTKRSASQRPHRRFIWPNFATFFALFISNQGFLLRAENWTLGKTNLIKREFLHLSVCHVFLCYCSLKLMIQERYAGPLWQYFNEEINNVMYWNITSFKKV